MEQLHSGVQWINSYLWHDNVLYMVLATGVLYTVWSVTAQYRALTHGTAITLGHYDDPADPGAINHFQALSTALSATVGLGNIGGVAIALALGGPGALFWMWVVGLLGMAVKMVEVTLSMLYRNVEDPENPHGGPMWVAKKAFAEKGPGWAKLGTCLGGFYCLTLLLGTFSGGNMFQAWNVAEVSSTYFGIPRILVGLVLSIAVAAVILGGIKRIGQVTSLLVPIMCLAYVLAGIYVIAVNISGVPEVISLIVSSAFNPTEASGAFIGGSVGTAMLWGMKRALYSSEIGQGSSAIAHCAAKTDEPVREGIVAGLEPFIDTLVVCTITGLVILLTGVWNRSADVQLDLEPAISQQSDGRWTTNEILLPKKRGANIWTDDSAAFVLWTANDPDGIVKVERWYGRVRVSDQGAYLSLGPLTSEVKPVFSEKGVYQDYAGASLTALAFDQTHDGLGKWLVTIAAWMFAFSTIVAWSYYGEQAYVYLFGSNTVFAYRLVYCSMTLIATLGFIRTDRELDAITTVGTGLVLISSMVITLLFGHKAVAAYRAYSARLTNGEFGREYHAAKLGDVVSGRTGESS